MDKQQIEELIKALEEERDRFRRNAEQEIAYRLGWYDGRIAALHELAQQEESRGPSNPGG